MGNGMTGYLIMCDDYEALCKKFGEETRGEYCSAHETLLEDRDGALKALDRAVNPLDQAACAMHLARETKRYLNTQARLRREEERLQARMDKLRADLDAVGKTLRDVKSAYSKAEAQLGAIDAWNKGIR